MSSDSFSHSAWGFFSFWAGSLNSRDSLDSLRTSSRSLVIEPAAFLYSAALRVALRSALVLVWIFSISCSSGLSSSATLKPASEAMVTAAIANLRSMVAGRSRGSWGRSGGTSRVGADSLSILG